MRYLKLLALLPLGFALGGCDFVVLTPAGDVAAQQRDLVVIATVLMLLIVVPVMVATALIAWRYRQSNTTARYTPDWDHSTQLELLIWAAPLLIIICLGAVTWMGTHLLDPYRTLGRIAADRPTNPDLKPLEVDVVALDWKWLFIYPEYGVASVNELAAPVNRPLDFKITASSVMNSFYIPALAGQIYAMPGMQTRLHAVINAPGNYRGFSANYSGAGFSHMHFTFQALADGDFDQWIAKAKSAGASRLGRQEYLALERPSENEPVRFYTPVDEELFPAILNMCVETGKMCTSEMMAIDAKGGMGLAGIGNTLPLTYDKLAARGAVFGLEPSYVAGGVCLPGDQVGRMSDASTIVPAPVDGTPLRGYGLARPGSARKSSTSFLFGRSSKSDS
ncbi:cytochrome o ubiquinol oxidase subunit II (Ubiquinol oxidase chain B) [Bradyrhizobium sp. STM 3843]|uniref:ubiquinol oxidase subunit II n=1 Tax=Bradyrhizobium sp. STM 3843 TaxID=551947 RepID=UPI000240311C|nr:ubiquinol oxidase subunit II [Bradyrhizobium sp. STM 3843]CCE11279.1 cytochrome o ubiquinol oxidase subunit II (Ubiquinol oxidase chain B) [Bradyrhizobium sp. STM 3843]